MEAPLKGRDFFGVLPTGFGKSLILQLFVLAKSRKPDNYCHLSAQSLMGEQITSNEFSLSAAELKFPNCVLKQQPHNLQLSDALLVFFLYARLVFSALFPKHD